MASTLLNQVKSPFLYLLNQFITYIWLPTFVILPSSGFWMPLYFLFWFSYLTDCFSISFVIPPPLFNLVPLAPERQILGHMLFLSTEFKKVITFLFFFCFLCSGIGFNNTYTRKQVSSQERQISNPPKRCDNINTKSYLSNQNVNIWHFFIFNGFLFLEST